MFSSIDIECSFLLQHPLHHVERGVPASGFRLNDTVLGEAKIFFYFFSDSALRAQSG